MSALWQRVIGAPAGRVFRAVGSVTVDELGAGRLVDLFRRRRRFDGEPLYAQVLAHGVRIESSDPLHRVVLRRAPYRATMAYHDGMLTFELAGPFAKLLRPLAGRVIEPWLTAVEQRATGRRASQ